MEKPVHAKKIDWLTPLLSALLFAFMLCVFVPVETFYAAGEELWFGVADFLWPMLLSFALVAAVFFGVGLLLRGAMRYALCALLVGLSLALYVQGSFANADYGVLDGSVINWAGFGSYPLWNTVMWAALALVPTVLALIFGGRSAGALRFVSVLCCLMLAVSLGALAFTQPQRETSRETGFTTENEFVLSKNKNVLVFVLDTLDTSSFAELLESEPALRERLDGFTWFRKMVGQYPVTTFAMPAMLTGEGYLYETSRGVYLSNAWKNDAFFHALKAEGYSTAVYSESEYAMEQAADVIDNIETQPIVPSSQLALWGAMMKLAGFRYAPHLLKPALLISTTDFDPLKQGANKPLYVFDDTVFLQQLARQGVSATMEQPAFRFYHLQGAHTPYNLKADGTRGKSSLREQLLTLFAALGEVFDQLKAQGLYDGATIVLTADHGNMTIDPAPILLVKRPGDSGKLAENDNLVWQQDLHATLSAASGLGADIAYGQDAFSLTEDDLREVAYYNYYWKEADRFYEYAVTVDDEGELLYKATGRTYEYGDVKENAPPTYTLGTRVPFDKPEDAVFWCDEMTSYYLTQAEKGVWFGAPDVRLHLSVTDEEYGDLCVTLGVGELKGESQTMKVIYDNTVQVELTLQKGDSEISFTVPWDAVSENELDVTLRFPDAVSGYCESGRASGATGITRSAVAFTDMVIESAE